MKYILLSLISVLHFSCNNVHTELEKALLFSGDNRTELEYVLNYYRLGNLWTMW